MEDLGEVLSLLGRPPGTSVDGAAAVLVGLEGADDAAVVRLGGSDALVLTLDFFTPLVDDAFTWGQIAAANAVSDVYAMGGRPAFALNVCAWPREVLPMALLADVMRGGLDVAAKAGMVVVGGHTIDDPEPKYGMCVVGLVDPSRMMTIDAARPGDVLVLTKPIGTGIITTALKRDAAPPEAIQAAVRSMIALNDQAAEAFVAAGVRACTDVTGFGLLGHLHRMLLSSGAAAELDVQAVALLPHARDLAVAGFVPGGTQRNLESVNTHLERGEADDVTVTLLADAQTSGGLLGACPPEVARDLAFPVVGRVLEGVPGRIVLR
jgi:selenide,water dikinase